MPKEKLMSTKVRKVKKDKTKASKSKSKQKDIKAKKKKKDKSSKSLVTRNLASDFRPRDLDDFIGQEDTTRVMKVGSRLKLFHLVSCL